MSSFIDLLVDSQTVDGKLVTTAVVFVLAVLISFALRLLFRWRVKDPLVRYHSRKIAGYLIAILALIAMGFIWRPFAGQLGLVIGLLGAGTAFALQEVIGAVAGWASIISGRIFWVGDRIEIGGVRGDVIDITLLRTKLMEIGSSVDDSSWVHGRQYTGRIVAVSNKKTFTDPVYNFSATFEYIWEELTIPVRYDADWTAAERIILEEVTAVSRSEGAQEAIRLMLKRYPVPRVEVEPHVFVRATDNWIELAARFIVPVRTARSVKDGVSRRIIQRLGEAGIEVASQTVDATIRSPRSDGSAGDLDG
ncbi:MAG: mechanosensitive ion channel domain-containing protein [bacterium]